MKKIQEIKDLKGKKVLVRVDFNVPVKNGRAVDTERLEAAAETINYLCENGAAVVLISHLGRPEGKKVKEMSLFQVVPALAGIINKKVQFLSEVIGEQIKNTVKILKEGDVLVLENLRFYKEEEENDEKFAKELAEGFDFYVNDAFSASHRAHASIAGVPKFLPAYAGFQFQKEVEALSELLEKPKKPFVMVSGGAKISDKIEILKNLLNKIDVLLIGGGMANTFLLSEGYEVGKSLQEEDQIGKAEDIVRAAEEKGVEVMLPDDVIVTSKISETAKGKEKAIEEIEKGDMIVDIGPRTVAKYAEPLKFAGTIFWNGPVGVAENKNFAKGTIGVAKIISEGKAKSVIGGGDTIAAVKEMNLRFDFVSMSGGAAMEFLSGKNLPGLEALEK